MARHYDPAQGRFTTQDTYLGSGGSVLSHNRYSYCSNDPVNYTDPSDHRQVAGTDAADAMGRSDKGSRISLLGRKARDSLSRSYTVVGCTQNFTIYRDPHTPGGIYAVDRKNGKSSGYNTTACRFRNQ